MQDRRFVSVVVGLGALTVLLVAVIMFWSV
jgi:hypothetical protein